MTGWIPGNQLPGLSPRGQEFAWRKILIGELRHGAAWAAGYLEFEVSEGVRVHSMRVGSVDGEHSRVNGSPVCAELPAVHPRRIAWFQNDCLAFALDVQFSLEDEIGLGVRVEVFPAAGRQLPFRQDEFIPTAHGSALMNLQRNRCHSAFMGFMALPGQRSIFSAVTGVRG